MSFRIGVGTDVHAFAAGAPLWVAGLEFPGRGQMLDGFSDVPYQLVDIAALTVLSIDLYVNFGIHHITRLRGWGNGANRCAVVKGFANAPWAPLFFHVVLQVATRHVEADCIAIDVA